ncbi:class I SAM-dependent methyltransferase [Massilia sp. H-1]|nr:class I SAM-dependent methyltransferase [Massilia sp. H-1]
MNIGNFEFLQAMRDQLGPMYGSEDLCVLLYSLVKREKPRVVVELGTGMGVSTAWIAAAMAENGGGTIYTVDNGGHFARSYEIGRVAALNGPLEVLSGCTTLPDFLAKTFERSGGAAHVKCIEREIDLQDRRWLDEAIGGAQTTSRSIWCFPTLTTRCPPSLTYSPPSCRG